MTEHERITKILNNLGLEPFFPKELEVMDSNHFTIDGKIENTYLINELNKEFPEKIFYSASSGIDSTLISGYFIIEPAIIKLKMEGIVNKLTGMSQKKIRLLNGYLDHINKD